MGYLHVECIVAQDSIPLYCLSNGRMALEVEYPRATIPCRFLCYSQPSVLATQTLVTHLRTACFSIISYCNSANVKMQPKPLYSHKGLIIMLATGQAQTEEMYWWVAATRMNEQKKKKLLCFPVCCVNRVKLGCATGNYLNWNHPLFTWRHFSSKTVCVCRHTE